MNFVKVMFPKAGRLPTDVPESEVVIFVLDLFDVETHSRHSFLEAVVAHLEQQSGLACIIESQEEDLFVGFRITTSVAPRESLLAQIAPHFKPRINY